NRINLSDSLSSLKTKLKSSFNFATDSDGNQNVVLNINSKKFTFSSTTSLSTVLSTISNDSDSDVKIAYDDINDKFSITSKDTGAGNNIQLSESTSTFLSAINFKSFKGAQAASLSYSNEKFNVSIDGTTKEITLNGNYGDYSSLAQDVQDKIRAAFTDKQVTVTANTDNSLSINLNSTGSTLLISSKNPDASNLGFTNTNYRFGEDAQVKIDGQNITRSSNTITTNGVTYNLLKESNTEQTVSLKPDTDTVFNNIKNFVTKYNDMIAKLNGTVSEQYDRDYPPLTDDQKAAMTADQITSWETKAKTGLLKDDYNLNRILNGMRTAMYDSISGLTTKLTDIGISTGDYSDKGKLIIDESKLKDAIANNPDGVMNLFSKKSDTYSSYSRDYTSDQRKTRYSEEGISQRISDIIEDNISTIRDSNGNKGILLQIAGITGDVSEYSNNYYTQISEYDTKIYDLSQKLTDKENQYYEKYAALEAAISKMNSQSSWLASQVGGSSS
ncbi:MAG: flagellar filament capping protein FliD, partial [Bacillota bacterium]|nr:flagellar filament capping protein FliD [Bacillota bacterium]